MSTGPSAANGGADSGKSEQHVRSNSFSQQSTTSETSQTAADFIRSQEILEADAREALPYSIDSCTNILGPLRQNIFACLTCNPPPTTSSDSWTPAGVCYACSIQCHGEHTLVEIFQKRNFTCDCGTKRIPSTSPCTLRTNSATNLQGDVHSEEPDANNKYNHNFKNRFCGCECDYDPFQQKGTMFQCLGLGTAETGGCGEDWYHPGCLVGMGPQWFEKMEKPKKSASPSAPTNGDGALATISEDAEGTAETKPETKGTKDDMFDEEEEDEPPLPPGFPDEESFESFICYKCVESNPWIKHYAGTAGFLTPVFLDGGMKDAASATAINGEATTGEAADGAQKKRKAEDDGHDQSEAKRIKNETDVTTNGNAELGETPAASTETATPTTYLPDCKLPNLNTPPPSSRFSLFFKEDFREHFCHCKDCYLHLNAHPQLLEEEEVYEPPMSDGDGSNAGDGRNGGGSTHGSGSLLERGESALRNVDRVRAIEGVMAYQHLKEQLKPFFRQFAESGQAVGAEDIKAYFAKLRGDEEGMKEAGEKAAEAKRDGDGDHRREQGGY
ncbi:putative zinc finger in n-recognin (UBR box) domain-containing protein [Sarocladium implicatum]|nr:putative zinc finger in n-recognin (UBR box) domain-containing protein [Sarocladium implicatum]